MITGFPLAQNAKILDEFRCPGESYSISRSVHFARLSTSYPKCRQCAHRPGADLEAIVHSGSDAATLPSLGVPRSLFTTEGMRGIYLNEIDRQRAAELSGAFASWLWDSIPHSSNPRPTESRTIDDSESAETSEDEGIRLLPAYAVGPTIVIGHDERPCAPDLITGVALALKRMGCQVVDIGLTTRPTFWFAVEHLQAVGGVHVTGAGCGPAWSGLDLVHGGAIPCSRGGTLDRVQDRFQTGYARASRRSGALRSFRATVPYEAGLWKHFHALRPLRIAFASPSRTVRDRFTQVFHKLACRLVPVETPVRDRIEPGPDVAESDRIAHAVQEHDAHLGLFVDDDGQRTVFYDEAGRRASARQISLLLARLLRSEFPGRAMIAARDALVSARPSTVASPRAVSPEPPFVECDSSLESCANGMRRHNAVFGADAQDRYWFAEGFPTCDAIVTLARLLQVLSRSDAPFSDVLFSVDPDARMSVTGP